MGDIDAARKKERKKRFTEKIVFKTMKKKKKKRKREKKKRGGQYNATISSPAGLQLDQKLKIKQQLQSAATGSSKQAAALPQQWQPENKRLKKADSPEKKSKTRRKNK